MYSDLHCPSAYLTSYRLRQLRDEYRGRVVVERKCLALEYVNKQPTPKPILDNETPTLLLEAPDIPYQPWHAPESEWPVTMWPAFEAVKCAERQGPEAAEDLDWAIRVAFFAESRCISMRHVLFDLAAEAGLDLDRFAADFDGGVAKAQVLDEAKEGWERLKVEGSPTFVLPSGEQRSYLGLPKVELDEARHYRLVAVERAECDGDACLDLLRQLFDDADTARLNQPLARRGSIA
ncbi:MAG: DsbA family protein [Chloroflexota bacterium]|nr:DsbA family protein [Chloroflexota bacterium]